MPTDYSSNNAPPTGTVPTQFIFPILKSSEILTCCDELEIELTKAELSEPQRHREGIRKVFWQLLDICFGLTEEDLVKRLPQKAQIDEVTSFAELHEDNMVDLLFFKELSRGMRVVGIYDFSWKDLHNPTPKRFRNQMSALINMAKFREEQLRKYYELMEPRHELVSALQDVHSEHDLLVQQLEKTQAESNVQLEEIEAVLRDCEHLESEIAKSNKLQASKREEAATLKRQVNDLKDQLASTTWAIQEAEAQKERLQAQIVSSPQRRRDELSTKREELEKDKEICHRLEKENEDAQTRSLKLSKAVKQLEELLEIQAQLLVEVNKYKAERSKIQETQKEIESNNEKTDEILRQIEEAERSLVRAEEKLQHTRKQAKMQMEAAQDRLDIAKEQLLVVEKERQDTKARIEAGEAEVKELEAQLMAEKENTEKTIAGLLSDFKVIEKTFLDRNEKRMQFIENVIQE